MAKINVIKIQTEVIKALIKNSYVGYCGCKDGVWITLDGYCAYNIPQFEFYIDMKTKTPLYVLRKNRDNFDLQKKQYPLEK